MSSCSESPAQPPSSLPIQFKLLHMLMSVVAPDSPMIAYKTGRVPVLEARRAQRVADTLLPGDIVLIRTPGVFYKQFRAATNQPYDHAVCVTAPGRCVHISSPVVRELGLVRFLLPRRNPLIVRVRMTSEERGVMAEALCRLVGQAYDLSAVRTAIIKLVTQDVRVHRLAEKCAHCKQRIRPSTTSSLLCTTAIMDAVYQIPRFATVIDSEKANLAYKSPNFKEATMTDFLHLANQFPQLFQTELPFDEPIEFQATDPTLSISQMILPKIALISQPVRMLSAMTNVALSTLLSSKL